MKGLCLSSGTLSYKFYILSSRNVSRGNIGYFIRFHKKLIYTCAAFCKLQIHKNAKLKSLFEKW